MRIISRKALQDAARRDRTLEGPLNAWFKVASKAEWKSLVEVRRTYPTADYVEGCTVFNIRGNMYRLIVRIKYEWKTIFIKRVLTHDEYDRGGWKNECGGA